MNADITKEMMTELKILHNLINNKSQFISTFETPEKIIKTYFDKLCNNAIETDTIKELMQSILVKTFNKINNEANYKINNQHCNEAIEECKKIFSQEQLNNNTLLEKHLKPFLFCIAVIHYYFIDIKPQKYIHEEFITSVLIKKNELDKYVYTSGEEDNLVASDHNTPQKNTPMRHYNKKAINDTSNRIGAGTSKARTMNDFYEGKQEAFDRFITQIIRYINNNDYQNYRWTKTKRIQENEAKTGILSVGLANKTFNKMKKMFEELKEQQDNQIIQNQDINDDHEEKMIINMVSNIMPSIFICPSGYGALAMVASQVFPYGEIVAIDRNPDAVNGLEKYFQDNNPHYNRKLYTSDVTKKNAIEKNKFDFFAGCPPYFNIEYYLDEYGSYETDQNINKDYEKWKEKLIIPFINTAECLSEDGIGCFILPTEDNKGNNVVTDTQKLLTEKGFTIIYLKQGGTQASKCKDKEMVIYFSRNPIYRENAMKRKFIANVIKEKSVKQPISEATEQNILLTYHNLSQKEREQILPKVYQNLKKKYKNKNLEAQRSTFGKTSLKRPRYSGPSEIGY